MDVKKEMMKLTSVTWGMGLLQSLDAMRKRNERCDLRIILHGGIVMNAHSSVISAASPFLKSLLSEGKDLELNMEGFPAEISKQIIEFIYTGSGIIKKSDLLVFHSMAASLDISALTEMAQKLIQGNLSKGKDEAEDLASSPNKLLLVTPKNATPGKSNAIMISKSTKLQSMSPGQSKSSKSEGSTIKSPKHVSEDVKSPEPATEADKSPKKLKLKSSKSAVPESDKTSKDSPSKGKSSRRTSERLKRKESDESNLTDIDPQSLLGTVFLEKLGLESKVANAREEDLSNHKEMDVQQILPSFKPSVIGSVSETLPTTSSFEEVKLHAYSLAPEDAPLAAVKMEAEEVDEDAEYFINEPDEHDDEDDSQGNNQEFVPNDMLEPGMSLSVEFSSTTDDISNIEVDQPTQQPLQVISRSGSSYVVGTLVAVPDEPSDNVTENQAGEKVVARKRRKAHGVAARKAPVHHGVTYMCEFCQHCFTDQGYYERHREKHAEATRPGEIKKFPCKYCKFSSNYQCALNEHTRLHTGETPYKCKYCEKKFTHRKNWTLHEIKHTGRVFQCDHCSKVFKALPNLRKHTMTVHTPDYRPHKCPICFSCFKLPEVLKRHLATHSSVKAHKCHHCNKFFTHQRSLRIHVKSRHEDSGKRYRCDVCSKEYKCQLSIKKHICRLDNDGQPTNRTGMDLRAEKKERNRKRRRRTVKKKKVSSDESDNREEDTEPQVMIVSSSQSFDDLSDGETSSDMDLESLQSNSGDEMDGATKDEPTQGDDNEEK